MKSETTTQISKSKTIAICCIITLLIAIAVSIFGKASSSFGAKITNRGHCFVTQVSNQANYISQIK